MFLFGLITLLQGLTRSLSGLVAARFFLGLAECGVFPACFYLIAMWYPRAETQKRFTFLFGSSAFSGAFGGLLASAIGNLDGARGLRGWRWVFIIGACPCHCFEVAGGGRAWQVLSALLHSECRLYADLC